MLEINSGVIHQHWTNWHDLPLLRVAQDKNVFNIEPGTLILYLGPTTVVPMKSNLCTAKVLNYDSYARIGLENKFRESWDRESKLFKSILGRMKSRMYTNCPSAGIMYHLEGNIRVYFKVGLDHIFMTGDRLKITSQCIDSRFWRLKVL